MSLILFLKKKNTTKYHFIFVYQLMVRDFISLNSGLLLSVKNYCDRKMYFHLFFAFQNYLKSGELKQRFIT